MSKRNEYPHPICMPSGEFARVFKEACIGYGFEEVPQKPDGTWCHGCGITYKRPSKMYSNGTEVMCRQCVVYFYNPEEER